MLPGADDGIRTRDPHLGKVMLYQLSHVRVSQLSYRPLASASRRSETPGPTTGRRELLDLGQRHPGNGEDDELSDLVAAADVDGVPPVQVDGDHLDLAPVPRVDEAGRVHEAEARPGCKAGAGLHEAGVAVRD